MSNFHSIEPQVVEQPIAETSTTQKHSLGRIIQAVDKATTAYGVGEFIYLKGAASVAVGTVVTYNADDYSTTRLAANAIGPVAVAMSACVADQYGWFQIQGKAVVLAGTVADNGNVYATATAGTVDDAVVAGDRVKRAKFASADGTPVAGQAECEIDRPFMDDAVAA
jgi:hypothetical protein